MSQLEAQALTVEKELKDEDPVLSEKADEK